MLKKLMIGLLVLGFSGAASAEEGHEHEQEQAGEALHLNEGQIAALGLKFVRPAPVAQVESYAWPAEVDIPLAHRDVVSAPIAGRIQKIHVVHGQVKRGQALFELESAELVRLQQAWLDAQAEVEKAAANFKRAKRLYQAGSLSEKQYLAAKTALAQARHQQDATYDTLLYAGLTQAQLKKLTQTGQMVRTLTIKAPKNGLLFDLQVERHQQVNANAPLAHIGEIEQIVVDVPLPIEAARKVRLGQAVVLQHLGLQGKVAYISQQADPDTQRVTVHALFENAGGRLLPGQFVRAQFVEQAPVLTWRVPNRALVALEGETGLFVREGETIAPQPVEVLVREADWALVRMAHVDEDMEIVAQGAIFLKGMMEGEGEGGAGHAH